MVNTNIEHIYLKIPSDYICVYHRILEVMSEYGEDMLKDCKASCTDRNKDIIDCFNMFNAALACRELDEKKKADLIIKYVAVKLNQLYPSSIEQQSFLLKVGEDDSTIHIICKGLFEFDSETFDSIEMFYIGSGNSYEEVIKEENKKINTVISGSYDLTVENNDEHIYVIVDSTYEIADAYIDNVKVIFNPPIEVLFEEHSIKVYESLNTYEAGNYNIIIS